MNSSRRDHFLVLSIGILIGLAIGFLFGGEREQSARAADPRQGLRPGQAPEAALPTESSADLEALAQAPTAAAREEARPATATDEATVSDAEVERAIAAAGPIEVEREEGDGTIAGFVRDSAGRPLAGAIVMAEETQPPMEVRDDEQTGAGAPPVDSRADSVRNALVAHANRQARQVRATTDALGRYVVEDLPDRYWFVRAYLEDYELTATRRAYRVRTNSELDFIAAEVVEVPLRVIDESGRAVNEAVIECTESRSNTSTRPTHYRWTAEEPSLRLVIGSYELSAMHRPADASGSIGDPYPLSSDTTSISLQAGQAPAEVVLVLAPTRGVHGRVRFPSDGVAPASPQLLIVPTPGSGKVDSSMLSAPLDRAHLGPGEDYAFTDLEPGRYTLAVTREYSGPPAMLQEVEVRDGLVRVDLNVPAVDLGQYLRVRAFGPDGEVLRNLSFSIRHERTGGGSSTSSARGTTTPDGVHLLTIPARSREAWEDVASKDSFSLQVRHSSHGEKWVPLPPGQPELEVRFTAAAQLRLTISGLAGSPYEGRVRVRCEPESELGRGWSQPELPGPSGVFESDALQPGPHVVLLVLSGGDALSGIGRPILKTTLELRTGPNEQAVALPPLHRVDLHVVDGPEDGRVRLMEAFDGDVQARMRSTFTLYSTQTELDADGRATLEDVPAGRYRLSAAGKSVEIDVPCDEIVLE